MLKLLKETLDVIATLLIHHKNGFCIAFLHRILIFFSCTTLPFSFFCTPLPLLLFATPPPPPPPFNDITVYSRNAYVNGESSCHVCVCVMVTRVFILALGNIGVNLRFSFLSR